MSEVKCKKRGRKEAGVEEMNEPSTDEEEVEQPQASSNKKTLKAKKPLPFGYICKACGAVDSHAIYDCPSKVSKKEQLRKPTTSISTSTTSEKHLKAHSSPVKPRLAVAAPPSPALQTKFYKSVFLSGLPFDMTKAKVLELIQALIESPCNIEEKNVVLMPFPDNQNRCRGIGYINCSNEEGYNQAILLHGQQAGKMTISAIESNPPVKEDHEDAGNSSNRPKRPKCMHCYRCGGPHDPKDCTNERICYRCRKTGHLSGACPMKKG